MTTSKWAVVVLTFGSACFLLSCGSGSTSGCKTDADCLVNFQCINGTCVEDTGPKCQDASCSHHGVCADSTGQVVCTCDQGYAGATCATCAQDYQDYGDGTCLPRDPCAADTTCAEMHRACENQQGRPVCGLCLEGYHQEGSTCTADQTCQDDSCNGHGVCNDSHGTIDCTCDPGYAGQACAPEVVWPISASAAPDADPIWDPYGPRWLGSRYDFHAGIDINVPVGTPVHSVAAGVVRRIRDDWEPGMDGSNWVLVEHEQSRFTAYLHLSRIDVVEDQVLSMGEVIALAGSTGANVPHLHLTYMLGLTGGVDERRSRNPLEWLPHTELPVYVEASDSGRGAS